MRLNDGPGDFEGRFICNLYRFGDFLGQNLAVSPLHPPRSWGLAPSQSGDGAEVRGGGGLGERADGGHG